MEQKPPWESFSGSSFENKRTDHRVHAGDQFVVEFRKKGQAVSYSKGHVDDLSMSGVAFTTMVALQQGMMLDLILYFTPVFPGMKKVAITAEIMRVDVGSGKFIRYVACRFREMAPAAREAIHNFMVWLLSRNIEGFGEDRLWKVSAHNQYFVEYAFGDKTYKGFGCELSQNEASFNAVFAPPRGSAVVLTLHYSPHFPGPTKSEIHATILQTRKLGNENPYYEIKCRLEYRRMEIRQNVQSFLKWLVAHPPHCPEPPL